MVQSDDPIDIFGLHWTPNFQIQIWGAAHLVNLKQTDPFFLHIFNSWRQRGHIHDYKRSDAWCSDWGGGQNIERANVERPIFRNKKIASVKRNEVQLFDFFILLKLFEHSNFGFFFFIWTLQFFIIFQIWYFFNF